MEPIFAADHCVCCLDPRIYPQAAVLQAAYAFVERCYVYLFYEGDRLCVRLRPRAEAPTGLAVLADEFLNELLDQALRLQLVEQTHTLRELILARALYGVALETEPSEAAPAPEAAEGTAEALLGPLPAVDATEDVLQIATDWFATPLAAARAAGRAP